MATNNWGIIFLLAMLATISTSVSEKSSIPPEYYSGSSISPEYYSGSTIPLSKSAIPGDKGSPSSSGSGKEFVVGDDKGWTKNINYIAWATDKEFCVGDKLIFKYPVGKHNVIQVDRAGYLGCIIPSTKPLETGQDSVTLDSPGRKFFICGIEKHCMECDMKLYVDVKAPAPIASSGGASPGSGKEILVGDDKGWTKNFDYQAWANGKEFYVGDTLVFKYPPGEHNVLYVCGKVFQSCYIPQHFEALALKSGNDKFLLDKPGKQHFVCAIGGNGKHCEAGMKLCIDVLPAPPTPTPIKGTRKLASTKNLSYN
ncbi:hypothetical protein OSB04_010701 [Centaurea solstitialis]|uniref:Phytocyanin domain-containing protein n=1 Tax=Centaurea solstitialis TaxID=347529 RepID=A0AA38WC80_9ASTR|nr:hypothetical protein OSB04_010701 [Centaurea solstitialis]